MTPQQLPLLPPPRDVLADARAVAERHRRAELKRRQRFATAGDRLPRLQVAQRDGDVVLRVEHQQVPAHRHQKSAPSRAKA